MYITDDIVLLLTVCSIMLLINRIFKTGNSLVNLVKTIFILVRPTQLPFARHHYTTQSSDNVAVGTTLGQNYLSVDGLNTVWERACDMSTSMRYMS